MQIASIQPKCRQRGVGALAVSSIGGGGINGLGQVLLGMANEVAIKLVT